ASAFVYVDIFFFQAEDGIRDRNVTGVQTCALPIWKYAERICGQEDHVLRCRSCGYRTHDFFNMVDRIGNTGILCHALIMEINVRSEERRVGKECRSERGR